MKLTLRTLFPVVVTLLLTVPVLAQTHRASIRGTVYDAKKFVITGATVTLTNTATGESRTVTTGDEGEYAISSLPPALYNLKVERANFMPYENDVELHVN